MPEYQTHAYDVLVIGAGGAGLRAAIEASSNRIVALEATRASAAERTEHSRLSCASPRVRARWTGKPWASTTA